MSTRWRIAGLVLAVLAFLGALVGAISLGAFLSDLPLLLRTLLVAVQTFIAVWLYEGIYLGTLRVARALRSVFRA